MSFSWIFTDSAIFGHSTTYLYMVVWHRFILPWSVFHSFLQSSMWTSMTKCQRSPSAAPLPKRSRKPTGFRVARPPPTNSQRQASTSSSSSLFVTVSQPDEQCVTLKAQSRLIPSTSGPSTTPSISDNTPEPEIENEGTSQADIEPTPDSQPVKPKRKRKTKNTVWIPLIYCPYCILTALQDQLNEWLKFRRIFLDEILRHDGLGDFLGHTKCSDCQNAPGVIKCKDCSSGRMLRCPECVVASHQALPLHRVEVRTTLGQITWCCWHSLSSAMEWQVFRQRFSPKPWSLLSDRPLWRSLPLSSRWSKAICHFRYHRPPSRHDQILWLQRETSIKFKLDSTFARAMVSGYPLMTSNRFYVRLPRTFSWTYASREDKFIWLLSHVATTSW